MINKDKECERQYLHIGKGMAVFMMNQLVSKKMEDGETR